ncbi:DUF6252 family protein [Hymenobacter sp. ASUV-10]|uniref:DUF6252 family protein n=1 Tax=Hymenobacter aranciens TaxID=3063996 RepID=A0ABT9BDJ7_9BACT|nr:DUF6252 family protein [Hymenobacter sp. ASUV-10]MDO7876336.1 DUF6252 family protein [Hymenobacter sp. ASUV-10]
MKNVFHTLTLTVVAGGALLLAGCDADNPSPNVSGTGSITGQIEPAEAVYIVNASNNANRTFNAQTSPVAGTYSFSNLADGTYTITYTAGTGYNTPAPQNVTVSGGGVATAPTVMATRIGTPGGGTTTGSNSLSVGGTAVALSTASAVSQAGSLAIIMGGASGQTVSLIVPSFANAAGTFPLTAPAMLTYAVISGTSAQQWDTMGAGGTGTLTVTAVGTNPRTVSGTFTATAVPSAAGGGTGNKAISGSFSNLAY